VTLRNLSALLAAGSALFFSGCRRQGVSASSQQAPIRVGVVQVVQRDVPIYGDWVGTLDGYTNANITPQVSGYLIRQDYREGTFVRKGDVLFEIDPRPFQAALDQARGQLAQAHAQLAQAQAQLGLATINVKRDTPLAAAQAIAQSQLDNDIQTQRQDEALVKSAEAAIQANEATVSQAELNLGFTKVLSLIDGIAGIATTQIGNLVGTSTTLTTVSQVDPIKVYFAISEQEYLTLATHLPSGRSVNLHPAAAHDTPLQMTLSTGQPYPRSGYILFADRQVNSQTGTIRIVGAFPNPEMLLRPGGFGRVRAVTALHKGALLVPQRAVSELQGRYEIAVVGADNKVSIRAVQVGDRVGDLWIITSGLSPGERVVADGTSKVREGVPVNPQVETAQ